jgi:predicted DNA-binding transcriptional regulator AlpA
MTPKMLTVQEAVTYTGMSRSFLDKARNEGNIGNRTPGPAWHKIGRKVMYSVDDLDAWIAAHRVERPAI